MSDFPAPIVSTAWLHDHLDQPDLVILDVRGTVLPATQPPPWYISHPEQYAASHIPGARFVNWITDITVDGPTQMQIAPPDKYAAFMGGLGIGDQTRVVAYDASGGMFAARVWWTLSYYGHAHVAVLDGGWPAWTAEGRPTTDALPDVTPQTFIPRPTPSLRLTKADVLAKLGGTTRLLDVRTPEEYRGEASRAKRSGHIPGAVNLPAKRLNAGAHGSLSQGDHLRADFAAAGAGDPGDVVLYCNGGVSASLGLLAYRAAGFSGGAVYDGSWKDWGNDDTTPVER
jgi:thiosulfate/3-mercaptopyruvate sulfurtransferase